MAKKPPTEPTETPAAAEKTTAPKVAAAVTPAAAAAAALATAAAVVLEKATAPAAAAVAVEKTTAPKVTATVTPAAAAAAALATAAAVVLEKATAPAAAAVAVEKTTAPKVTETVTPPAAAAALATAAAVFAPADASVTPAAAMVTGPAAAATAKDTGSVIAANLGTAAITGLVTIAATNLGTAIKTDLGIAVTRVSAIPIEAASALVRQHDAALVAAQATEDAAKTNLASKSIDDALAGIRTRMNGAPGSVPGAYTVRVLGVRKAEGGAAARRHPLPAVPVQLASADTAIVAVIADAAGVALLRPPPELEGKLPAKLELQVLGSDGKPAARLTVQPTDLGGAGRLIEVAETAVLSVSFEYGKAWLAAEDAAVKRAAELKTLSAKALTEHAAAIKVAVANIDSTLSRILSTNKEIN